MTRQGSDTWVVVPGWDRYQRDSTTSWIKVYLELNSRDDWLELSTAARGMLTTIWVEYARSARQLSVKTVMQLCGKSARSSHLDQLNHAGFVEIVAEKPSRARVRAGAKEKIREDLPKKVSKPKSIDGRKVTGYRFVRGSHSGTYVPDPFGTDTPPYPVPKETR